MSRLALRLAPMVAIAVTVSMAVVARPGVARAGPGSVTVDGVAPAFTYTRAGTFSCPACTWSKSRSFVRVMPTGTILFQARSTTAVRAWMFGAGGRYDVSVDGGVPIGSSTSSCGCWELDPVASGLAPSSTHSIVVTNANPPDLDQTLGPLGGLDVGAWQADRGGFFPQWIRPYASTDPAISYTSATFVPDPNADSGTLAMVPAGATVTLWVEHTGAAQIEVVENGASVLVSQAEKLSTVTIALPNSGRYRQYRMADWGIPDGPAEIRLKVVSGTLALDRVVLFESPNLPLPQLMAPADALAIPVLTAYGDSITWGYHSLGPSQNSDGYMDRAAPPAGLRLVDAGVGGATATCYGVAHTHDVTVTSPSVVVVAFGVNDMLGGGACRSSVDLFRSSMDLIVTQLQTALPGVPIYLGAILPTVSASDATRAQWNQAIQDVAAARGVAYVDPSSALDPATDFIDVLHPDNGGAAAAAAVWAAALTGAA